MIMHSERPLHLLWILWTPAFVIFASLLAKWGLDMAIPMVIGMACLWIAASVGDDIWRKRLRQAKRQPESGETQDSKIGRPD
jgi:hypothetical protein